MSATKGIPCPACGARRSQILRHHTDAHPQTSAVSRRRRCLACGHEYPTLEVPTTTTEEDTCPATSKSSK